MFPTEGGRKNRIIPFLPGKRYLARSKELADRRLPEIADYARKLVQLPAKIAHSQLVLDFFSDEKRRKLQHHGNVLSEVLTDVTVASMNSHSNSRHEASRQSAGWESPATGRKFNPVFSTINQRSSSPASRVVLPHHVPSNPMEDTPSTFTRSTFAPVPHMPAYPLTRPPLVLSYPQPGFPMRQPHIPFMHHQHHQQFTHIPQANFKSNNATQKMHPLLNVSSSPAMIRPPSVPARPQFRPHSERRDKHYDDSGMLNRVYVMPGTLRNESRQGEQSFSFPCSLLPSSGQPQVRSSQFATSIAHPTRTPSPVGRQRHSSSASSSPGLVQDLCVITSLYDWLKALRLHKYYHLFEKMTYEEVRRVGIRWL
jgi:hypothetical protein